MIRSLALVCSGCEKPYTAAGVLYYREDYKALQPLEKRLLCPACIAAWEARWQLAAAVFHEQDHFLYVDLVTTAGEEYKDLDCSVLDDRVVVSIDLPEAEKIKLHAWYKAYQAGAEKDKLKFCQFHEAFMKTTFTCETMQGERYEDVAFRVTRQGALETEITIPEAVSSQVLEAWRLYSLTN